MIQTLSKALFVFAACLYLGGSHLAFLQVVAWSGMLVSYSAEEGLAGGLRDTFSGERPCAMCKAISKVRSNEASGKGKSPALPRGMDKIWTDMLPIGDCFRLRWVALDYLNIGSLWLCPASDAQKARPPVPPPRILA